MPKQRQTCTRCSQRRQKCDRKSPCTRCIQSGEGNACTTKWLAGYNPSVHRKYPRKSSPVVSWQSTALSDTSSSGLQPNDQSTPTSQLLQAQIPTPTSTAVESVETPSSAWPPRLPDITIGSLLSEKDQQTRGVLLDQTFSYVKSKTLRDSTGLTGVVTSCYSPVARAAEIQYLQSILPPKEKVIQIIEYYEQFMLYWIGGLYHGPTFKKKLLEAYGTAESLDLQSLDWRWTALLFSVMSSGIIGASEASSTSWGFTIDDKVRLSRDWGAACIACLNLGNYTSQYHICSVQAIYIMHAYEHLVGSTSQWIALRSVAVVIAKGLKLHQLGPHPDDSRIRELDPEHKQAFIEREIGRRTWFTLASQEWLCATSQNSHTISIQKRHFTSTKPLDLDEDTMEPIHDTATPTFTLVSGYFFDYATLLLDFHNVMIDAEDQDEQTQYAMVLRFDGDMRATCAEKIPKCLSPQVPFDPKWPKWVAWARRLHQASVNNKIIMIHQHYLSKSFKDARYTYSRWACATAAKNVINIYNTRDPEEPQWWVEQAFIVTAGICLILDLFHRSETDPEASEYQACVRKAVNFLQQFYTSSVAVHGVRILLSLLQEYAKLQESSRGTAAKTTTRSSACAPFNMVDLTMTEAQRATHPLPADMELPLLNDEFAQFNFDIDAMGFEDLMDYFPTEGGLTSQILFESIPLSYGL